ncbi:MAG: hypothetical protein IT529_04570 [Burkholderiales bacterium]|nr:hypothetical protein [Burkholderiales bacterium]
MLRANPQNQADFKPRLHDPRFAQKKPRVRGTWIERCGDNFYRQDSKGAWIPLPSRFHSAAADHRKDTAV